MRILAIIPAYNEEDCIEQTVRGLKAACPHVDYLIVNDGSTDATRKICEQNGFTHVNLPVNSGLSVGFQTGMKYAVRHGYDAAVQFDADGQHLPQYIPHMAEVMEREGASIVIASRVLAGEGPTGARGAGAKLISALIRLTSGISITDPTSGMRMYNKELMQAFASGHDLTPEPDTVALFARRGAKVTEVPARMQERQGGESYFDLPHVVSYMSRICFSILLFQWFR
ncbi:MAG: glycosyltransferase family 2 protein [Coriobacteriales bacterium]|nr:glycosyltransferase family 2 protein [Coriobacteriales bacterium]